MGANANENAIKLIGRFIPKGTDIGKLGHREIRRIEYWINHYPRYVDIRRLMKQGLIEK